MVYIISHTTGVPSSLPAENGPHLPFTRYSSSFPWCFLYLARISGSSKKFFTCSLERICQSGLVFLPLVPFLVPPYPYQAALLSDVKMLRSVLKVLSLAAWKAISPQGQSRSESQMQKWIMNLAPALAVTSIL